MPSITWGPISISLNDLERPEPLVLSFRGAGHRNFTIAPVWADGVSEQDYEQEVIDLIQAIETTDYYLNHIYRTGRIHQPISYDPGT